MLDSEEKIAEVIEIDYEIMDVKLEKCIKHLYHENNQEISDYLLERLLPLWWMLYVQRN